MIHINYYMTGNEVVEIVDDISLKSCFYRCARFLSDYPEVVLTLVDDNQEY